jgi:hypothetical protein
MILTEAEAKIRVCPVMTRPVLAHHGHIVVEFVMCQGTGCMAWRWLLEKIDDGSYRPSHERGFCGAAIQPAQMIPAPIPAVEEEIVF